MVYRKWFLLVPTVLIFTVNLDAVTVNPGLCPTNKIAPHRRTAATRSNVVRGRTLGEFYDLLLPNNGQYAIQNSLQEEPQKDDPEDCGDIEDYDENDLSSVTPHRREGFSRFFFGGQHSSNDGSQYPNRPNHPQRPQGPQIPARPQNPPNAQIPPRPQIPQRPPVNAQYPRPPLNPVYPVSPQRPPSQPPLVRPPVVPSRPNYPPARPPYASGGFFSNNNYRPPEQQYPSADIKPVHEEGYINQASYRPDVVGGPLGHVVGVSPARPINYLQRPPPTSYNVQNTMRYPQAPIYDTMQPVRRPRARNVNNNGIIGSFFDLLF